MPVGNDFAELDDVAAAAEGRLHEARLEMLEEIAGQGTAHVVLDPVGMGQTAENAPGNHVKILIHFQRTNYLYTKRENSSRFKKEQKNEEKKQDDVKNEDKIKNKRIKTQKMEKKNLEMEFFLKIEKEWKRKI